MNVGIRELRSELRRWLDEVKAGKDVVVTDRGKPVARLTGMDEDSTLQRLIASGIVKAATARKETDSGRRRVRARGSVSELVKEQRR